MCVSSHLDSIYAQMDINHHFDLNSCSYGVKIEVKHCITIKYTSWCYGIRVGEAYSADSLADG